MTAGEDRIRVLFLTDLLDVGGAETQLVELVRQLDRDRFDARVAVLRGGGALIDQFDVPVDRLNARGIWDPRVWRRFAVLLRRHRFQAIYTTHVHSALLARAHRRRVPPGSGQRWIAVITTEHSYKNPVPGPVLRFLRRRSACPADAIVAVAEAQAVWLRKELRVPDGRVVVIPNGVDPARFDPLPAPEPVYREFGIRPDEPLFVCVARLVPVKDHATLLSAMERVDARLILLGDGPERPAIERRITDGALHGKIFLAGTRDDVRPFLAAGWATCLSSRDESQGIALIEAMAAGRPVIATRAGGIPEVVDDGRTGLLAPCGDAAAFAAAMHRAIEDRDWRLSAGAAARAEVMRRFTIQNRTRAIERLIAEQVAAACR